MNESENEKFDAIVIGGGLGGLSCAAHLAKRGCHVILFEQHHSVGGYATSFQRRAPDGDLFDFEASIHAIAGCGVNGIITQILRDLGAENDVRFVDISGTIMKLVLPDRTVDFCMDQGRFMNILIHQFPEEKESVRKFFGYLNRLWELLPDTKTKPLFSEGLSSELSDISKKSILSVFQSYFIDQRIFLCLYAPIAYCGLDLSQIDLLKYAAAMREVFLEKSYWISGGSRNLSQALALAISQNGGEVRVGSRVRKIIVEDGKARGVELEDGSRIKSRCVVSNADATLTFLEMVGEENLPREFLDSFKQMTASWSYFQVYLGLDEKFQVPEDLRSCFEIGILPEQPDSGPKAGTSFAGLTNYTLLDPSLAEGGKQIVTIGTPLRVENLQDAWGVASYLERNEAYYKKKNAMTDQLISMAEKVYPGLREHILVMEAATPLTAQRYTLNKNGCYVGFDLRHKRLPQRTPINDLYLAGAWTEPHGGVLGVILSGKQAAEMIIDEHFTTAAC